MTFLTRTDLFLGSAGLTADTEYITVTWTDPADGQVMRRVSARIEHDVPGSVAALFELFGREMPR